MSTYLVTVPVDFTDEPSTDLLSALNDSLSKHDPQQSTFNPDASRQEFVTHDPSTGMHLFRVKVDADDTEGAENKARVLVNGALLDAGHTVLTAETDTRTIHAEPWDAAADK
ncbi:hypothetical protein EAO70_09420 [Streptomyces sp. adm13(2018)]|uniref:hypothetical protein n=1 Tax=Streptomyces sp. adm13(2018) TaxID=2479007 RepID=UPI0011CEC219|nr:hypothetical protein [Streptomyces sp. adm13(2018)]TXS20220.1 hypothetical protein EAO70_09420 [Streptomyces sp. adm13(2018)]